MPISLRFRGLYLLLIGVLLVGLLASPSAYGQGRRRVVQFTGIVATSDSLLGVPGATVYVARTGLGTVSNAYGYFSLAVLSGDSIVIRSLGFATQNVVIPKGCQPKSYSVIIQLQADALLLGEVRVFPYSTERDFRRAYLALRLPGGTSREQTSSSCAKFLSPSPWARWPTSAKPCKRSAMTTTVVWAAPPINIPTTRWSTPSTGFG